MTWSSDYQCKERLCLLFTDKYEPENYLFKTSQRSWFSHFYHHTHIKCQLHCKRRLCISLQSFLAFCNWICKIILSELICHLASHLRNDILAHGHLRPCGFFLSRSLKMQSKGSDFIAHSNYNLKDGHHLLAILSLNWCWVIIVRGIGPLNVTLTRFMEAVAEGDWN